MPDAADLLIDLDSALAAGRVPAPETVAWLRRGIQGYRAGTDLETSLLLRGERGQRSARQRLAEATRNMHLRRAWRLLDEPRPWTRSTELAMEIQKYESAAWPRDRTGGAPGTDDPLRRELFAAFSAGLPMPESVMHLHRIATR